MLVSLWIYFYVIVNCIQRPSPLCFIPPLPAWSAWPILHVWLQLYTVLEAPLCHTPSLCRIFIDQGVRLHKWILCLSPWSVSWLTYGDNSKKAPGAIRGEAHQWTPRVPLQTNNMKMEFSFFCFCFLCVFMALAHISDIGTIEGKDIAMLLIFCTDIGKNIFKNYEN